MTDEYSRFCVRCGANLPEGATFCPKCGSPADGSENPSANRSCGGCNQCTPSYGPLDSTKTMVMFYAAGAIMLALIFLISSFGMSEEMWSAMEGSTMGMTMEEFKTLAIMCGCFGLLSGLFALMTYINVKRYEHWKLCVVTCALASVLSIGMFLELGIITVIVGALMTYRIHKNKDCFSS